MKEPGRPPLRDEFPAENTIFGEVHVLRPKITIIPGSGVVSKDPSRRKSIDSRVDGVVQRLPLEVLLERSLAHLIVLKRNVAVRREGTG
jgi:hypothetical protein